MTETGSARHGFETVGDLRLHRLEYGGDGRAVVLIHGVTGHAWMWHDVAAGLAGAGRVIGIDMRGHGDSQWSAAREYRTEDHLSDLEGLISSLGISELDLVGSSWGALVGLAFAARNPASVRRLALVDVEPSFEQGETDVFPRPQWFTTHKEAVDWERQNNPHAPDGMIHVMAATGTRPGSDGRLYRKHDPFFFERWPFRSDDRWDELRGLEMPVLVVHADQTWVRPDVAERMAKEAPQGRVVQVRDSGHLIPVEQPDEVARILREFLA